MPAAFSAISVRAMLTARSSGMVSSAPDAALASAAGLLGRVAVLGDHRRDAERGGRAQDGADIARVGDLVEHDQRTGPFQRLLQAGRGQRIGEQRHALVGDVAAEQVVEPAAIDLLGRHRPGRRLALREGLLGLLGQHQVAEAAGRIGQRRGDGVQAVEPDGAARGVRNLRAGAVVALAVGAVEVVARPLAVLVVLVRAVLERLALRTRAAVVGLAVRARRTRALRASVLRTGALALAGRGVVAALLAVVRLAGQSRGGGKARLGRRRCDRGLGLTAGGRQRLADARRRRAAGVRRFHCAAIDRAERMDGSGAAFRSRRPVKSLSARANEVAIDGERPPLHPLRRFPPPLSRGRARRGDDNGGLGRCVR